jgi:hypothetical protein
MENLTFVEFLLSIDSWDMGRKLIGYLTLQDPVLQDPDPEIPGSLRG